MIFLQKKKLPFIEPDDGCGCAISTLVVKPVLHEDIVVCKPGDDVSGRI